MQFVTQKPLIIASGVIAILLLALMLSVVLRTPRADRNWEHGLSRAPLFAQTHTSASTLTVQNFRAFAFDKNGTTQEVWRDETISADTLQEIWFFVEPFEAWDGVAHSFLSFVFADDTAGSPNATKTISVSVEARREEGEAYSGLTGMFNAYELIYIWSSEKDILTRIAVNLDHELYAYRLKVTPAQANEIFTHFVERTNTLHERPRFYNTLTSNCTNELAKAVNNAFPGALPWHYSHVLTGYSAERLHKLGFVDVSADQQENLRADAGIRRFVGRNAHLSEAEFSSVWRSEFAHSVEKNR